MINLFELGVERYWNPPSTWTKNQYENRIEQMINSGEWIFSRKYDGNFLRFVKQKGEVKLQSRGSSKKTGESHCDLQHHVLFMDSLSQAFSNDTVLLGEVYLEKGTSNEVGSILRCLVPKAIERQKKGEFLKYRIFDCLYYNGESFLDRPASYRVSFLKQITEKINNPLVSCVDYYEMNDTFYTILESIFEDGGEGCVCIKKNSIPEPSAKTARANKTYKCKRELEQEIDCVITKILPATQSYEGKHLETWEYYLNLKTMEKLQGIYIDEYTNGTMPLIPISKDYFYNRPSAIEVSVYTDNGILIKLTNVAGLTEQLKDELKDNPQKYLMTPITITGMMLSQDQRTGNWSIRHPKIVKLREGDINISDCLLSKIIG